jgi:hypothetical protein
MRFLHTADWQIGMKAAALGDAGARVREERLVAGRRVVELRGRSCGMCLELLDIKCRIGVGLSNCLIELIFSKKRGYFQA